jgi:hypothetical protein
VNRNAGPRVAFVIGGVQKAGTSALARYLAAHPGLALPVGKEAHVFDAAGFDEAWTPEAVDARYAAHFDAGDAGRLHGDATPNYALHPRFVQRIHRYNPRMRWILILRHPVERLLSNYHMERGWGRETLPLWRALLLEKRRLAGHMDDFAEESPLRRCSYRLRSDYARQLDQVLARFPAEQVLVLRTEDLAERPAETYARTCGFLGVPVPEALPAFERVFEGSYRLPPRDGLRWRLLSWWLRRELRAMDRRYGLRWHDEAGS